MIADGTVSCVDVTKAYLERIVEVHSTINAVLQHAIDPLANAAEADRARRSGRRLGPLHDVPFTIKDRRHFIRKDRRPSWPDEEQSSNWRSGRVDNRSR